MRKYVGVVLFVAVIVLSLVYVVKGLAVDAIEAKNPEAEPILVYGHSRIAGEGGIAKISAEPMKIFGLGQLYNGPCRVYSITMYSDTAGDMIGVYDAGTTYYYGNSPTVTNSLEFEIGIS
jgi:hypothetical protein